MKKEKWKILTNKEIYASVKIPIILDTIRLNRLHWFGHVLRMEKNIYIYIYTHTHTYRMSQEECARLREGVPYVKVYRYNPQHLCPKLNGYGDNGQRSLKL